MVSNRLQIRQHEVTRIEALIALDGSLPRRAIASLRLSNVRRDDQGRAVVTIGKTERGVRKVEAVALPVGPKSQAVLRLIAELADAPKDRSLFGLSEEAIRHRIRRMRRP